MYIFETNIKRKKCFMIVDDLLYLPTKVVFINQFQSDQIIKIEFTQFL